MIKVKKTYSTTVIEITIHKPTIIDVNAMCCKGVYCLRMVRVLFARNSELNQQRQAYDVSLSIMMNSMERIKFNACFQHLHASTKRPLKILKTPP